MTGGSLLSSMQSARESAGTGAAVRLAVGRRVSSCQHDSAPGWTSSRPGAFTQYRYPSPKEWPAPERRRSLHPLAAGGCLPGQESPACARTPAVAGCAASGAILNGAYPCRRSSSSLVLSLLPARWPPVVKLPLNAPPPAPSSVALLPRSPARTSPTAPSSAVPPVLCPARSCRPRRTASDSVPAGFRPERVSEGPSGFTPRRSFFFARFPGKS